MPAVKPISEKKFTARELLALNLIRLRALRGFSQEALALESGLHRTFIGHVERQARNISVDNIEKIAHALQVPIAELLTSPSRTTKR